jgi:hypothetical protein
VRGLGYRARGHDTFGNLNTTPGDVIQNYKWLGYVDADVTKGLGVVQLADVFDPKQARYKLLHISVAAVWCPPCNQETDGIVPVYPQLEQMGVLFIQAVTDGPTQGVPATTLDLEHWITKHASNFTEMLDPSLQLGQLFTSTTIPLNIYVDPRSMEILDAYEGLALSANSTGQVDYVQDAQTYLTWIAANPRTAY